MKRQTIMIATLMITALVMAAMLVFPPFNAPQARAEMSGTVGDYTLTSVANPVGGDGAIVVVDNRLQKTLVYRISVTNGTNQARITGFGKLDLAKAFAAPGGGRPR